MKKTKFIFTLMLGVSMATMARADDTSYDNCVAAGLGDCYLIDGSQTEFGNALSGTYYTKSGPENNLTMTVYGPTGSESMAAEVTSNYFYGGSFMNGVTSLKTLGKVNIRQGGFAGVTGLTSVDLTGAQLVEGYAFWGTTGLTSIVISDSLLDADGNILEYAERDGAYTGINPDAFRDGGLQTIYCPAGKTCANNLGISGDNIVSYSIDGNGQIKVLPSTPSAPVRADIRIYTIDEANAVAGKVNRFRIKYR